MYLITVPDQAGGRQSPAWQGRSYEKLLETQPSAFLAEAGLGDASRVDPGLLRDIAAFQTPEGVAEQVRRFSDPEHAEHVTEMLVRAPAELRTTLVLADIQGLLFHEDQEVRLAAMTEVLPLFPAEWFQSGAGAPRPEP